MSTSKDGPRFYYEPKTLMTRAGQPIEGFRQVHNPRRMSKYPQDANTEALVAKAKLQLDKIKKLLADAETEPEALSKVKRTKIQSLLGRAKVQKTQLEVFIDEAEADVQVDVPNEEEEF